jgi:ABC-type nitrate/sulfonate/bicarbonate transport system ATPase subunit
LRPLKKESAKAKSARAVCAEGISKSYGEKTVLRDLSVCFEVGKAACLMGPSGCGKTTFLRLLGGLESVDDGVINGADGEKAMVFQEDRLVEVMNAVQNAMLGRCDVTKEEAQALLSELGLAEDLKKPAHALSGGMRRRVAIARALLSHAPLLLLDEAFKGLDGETKKTVVDAVRRYTSGKTLIAVTHDAEDAALLGADIFPMPLLQM